MAAKKFRYRLSRNRFLARLLDAITPRPGVLVGANASAWKKDVLAVNGFDETYTYGSDDKDLGVRMTNNGVKSRRLKYSLVCVHLSHPRAYAVTGTHSGEQAEAAPSPRGANHVDAPRDLRRLA